MSINQSGTNVARAKAPKFTFSHVKESMRGIKIDSITRTPKCFHNWQRLSKFFRKQPNYTKFSRYVHSIVTCGPLSGFFLPLVLIACLLGWIQLFFLYSQTTLTCIIRVAVERKTTISNKKQQVLATNTSKSYRIICNS